MKLQPRKRTQASIYELDDSSNYLLLFRTTRAARKSKNNNNTKKVADKSSKTIPSKSIVKVTKYSKQQENKVRELARKGSQTHRWEFVDDRKNWSKYDSEASKLVEMEYQSWQQQPSVFVRSVHSGDWNYSVNFNTMEQTNVGHHNHRVRKIRRVAVGGNAAPTAVAPGLGLGASTATTTTTVAATSGKPLIHHDDDDDGIARTQWEFLAPSRKSLMSGDANNNAEKVWRHYAPNLSSRIEAAYKAYCEKSSTISRKPSASNAVRLPQSAQEDKNQPTYYVDFSTTPMTILKTHAKYLAVVPIPIRRLAVAVPYKFLLETPENAAVTTTPTTNSSTTTRTPPPTCSFSTSTVGFSLGTTSSNSPWAAVPTTRTNTSTNPLVAFGFTFDNGPNTQWEYFSTQTYSGGDQNGVWRAYPEAYSLKLEEAYTKFKASSVRGGALVELGASSFSSSTGNTYKIIQLIDFGATPAMKVITTYPTTITNVTTKATNDLGPRDGDVGQVARNETSSNNNNNDSFSPKVPEVLTTIVRTKCLKESTTYIRRLDQPKPYKFGMETPATDNTLALLVNANNSGENTE